MLQQVSLLMKMKTIGNQMQLIATSWKFDVGQYHDGIGKKLSCLHVKVFTLMKHLFGTTWILMALQITNVCFNLKFLRQKYGAGTNEAGTF